MCLNVLFFLGLLFLQRMTGSLSLPLLLSSLLPSLSLLFSLSLSPTLTLRISVPWPKAGASLTVLLGDPWLHRLVIMQPPEAGDSSYPLIRA